LAGVAALLGAALLAATFGNPSIEQRSTDPQPSWEDHPPAPEHPTHIFPTEPPPFAESPPILPAWIGWVITGVCAAFVLDVVALLHQTRVFPSDPRPFHESPRILPAWSGWVITGVCAAFVVVVVALVSWFFLRDRLQRLRAPAQAAIADPRAVSRTRGRMREAR